METTKLLALILVQLVRQLSGQPNCALNQAVMTCHYEIPKVIPPNVHNVFILDLKGSLESYKFADASWKSVTHLDIVSNTPSYELKAHIFSLLISLERLGFHHSVSLIMHKQVFAGLENVEVLDLSGCRRLYLDNKSLYPSFFDALSEKGVLPRLNTLNLINVGNYENRPLLFDADFLTLINGKGIKSLFFGEQTFLVDFVMYEVWPNPPYDPCPVQSIYASSVMIITKQHANQQRMLDTPFFEVLTNLKHVTLSNITLNSYTAQSHILCRNNSKGSTFFLTFILFVKEFTFQNIITPMGDIYGTIDAYECTLMRLKQLTLNNCGIGKINITFTIPENAYLDELDLSNNDISYFFIKGNVQSKRLGLSNNNLQKMNIFPEFSQAFVTWTMLEYLDLGRNALLNLPRDIFSRNLKLEKLFLNDNGLTTVPITLKGLTNLKLLDLRNNLIKSLDANAMVDVQTQINLFNTTFDLTKNPFECACKTTEFVKWVSSNTNRRLRYICYMERKPVTIDGTTYQDCKFLCYRDGLYVGISLMCLIVAIVLVLVTTKRYLTLQKLAFEKVSQAFITDFIEGNIKCNTNQKTEDEEEILEGRRVEFLVMLAYHSYDYDMCKDNIFYPLNNGLKALMCTEKDLILFGLEHEQQGLVLTEMERCTLISCVLICVVTREFCSDPRREIELDNACINRKPIVFLMCENVNGIIPQVMNALLRKSLVVAMNDQDQIPDWDTICKYILTTAVKANMKSEANFSLNACLWQTLCTCSGGVIKRLWTTSTEEDAIALYEM